MAGSATPLTATKVTRFRDAEMESMERIDDQTKRLKTPRPISSFEMPMEMALEMDPNVDRSCTIIHNVKKDIRAYYEVLEEKRKNAQQMTLDAFITAKPSTPSAPTTPRTSKQNTTFRQLFKTSVNTQPSTSQPQPSTSEPQPQNSGEQQLSVQIDTDNESEVVDDPGSDDESEMADDPGSDDESEVADDPGNDDESEVVDDPGSADESEVVDDPGSDDE
ncbi:hypothetical protein Hamer_G000113, partial [Homarus americanus]